MNKNIIIDDKHRLLLGKIRATQLKEYKDWAKLYPELERKYSPILSNQSKHLMEVNQTVDIGGYNSFILDIARKVFAKSISDKIVSIQPMTAPQSKVFYYSPSVTTGNTKTDFASMYTSNYSGLMYDQSRGAQSILSGGSVSLSSSQISYSAESTFPYSGNEVGLTSLKLIESKIGSTTSGTTNYFSNSNGTTVTTDDSWSNPNYVNDGNLINVSLIFSTSGSLVMNLSSSTAINKYGINPSTGPANAPKVWDFYGSNDSSTWVLLDSDTKLTWSSNGWYYKEFSNTTPYQYYKLSITEGVSPTGIIVGEFQGYFNETIPGGFYEREFTISPQTWARNLFSGNQITLITSGSSTASTYFTTWKNYDNLEAESTIQEIKLTISSQDVFADQNRKMVARWTEELEQDLEAYFHFSINDGISDLLSNEISAEIDREIISDLIRIAPYRAEWIYDQYSLSAVTGMFYNGDQRDIPGIDLSGITQDQWAKDSLLTKINQVSGVIGKNNIYHQANWIVCSSWVGTIIESMPEFISSKVYQGGKEIVQTGKLKGQYVVFVDPQLPSNILLMGYKGFDTFDCGYIYAPYILADLRDSIDPNTLFVKSKNIMSRYGKKIIDNKKYAMIDCIFPIDYSPTTNST